MWNQVWYHQEISFLQNQNIFLLFIKICTWLKLCLFPIYVPRWDNISVQKTDLFVAKCFKLYAANFLGIFVYSGTCCIFLCFCNQVKMLAKLHGHKQICESSSLSERTYFFPDVNTEKYIPTNSHRWNSSLIVGCDESLLSHKHTIQVGPCLLSIVDCSDEACPGVGGGTIHYVIGIPTLACCVVPCNQQPLPLLKNEDLQI